MKHMIMPAIAVVVLLSGCTTFKVKDAAGLQLAYEDVDRASSKAVELRSLKNVPDKQKQEATDLYRDAKAKINAYLQGSITRASSYVVDEPVDNYKSTQASNQVAAFLGKVNELRSVTVPSSGPNVSVGKVGTITKGISFVGPDAWIELAATAVEEVKKLNDQDQKAAYDRYVATVTRYLMKNYEELPGG